MKIAELYNNDSRTQSPLTTNNRWPNPGSYLSDVYYPFYWEKGYKRNRTSVDVADEDITRSYSSNKNAPIDYEFKLDLLYNPEDDDED